MKFATKSELEAYIVSRCGDAIIKAQEQVYQIIDRFVKEYYAEFSPTMYERTYQLYKSLVKSNIVSTKNGVTAEIYFDIETLDYYMKKIHGKEFINKGWSAEKTLSSAAHGSHGGFTSGTAIWDEPLKMLDVEAYNILKRNLISSGIPLK